MKPSFFSQKLDYIRYADWKSITWIVIVATFLTTGLFAMFNISYIAMLWSTKWMNGAAKGIVVGRVDKYGIENTKYGNRATTFYVKFDYEYKVSGNQYYGTSIVTPSLWNRSKFSSLRFGKLPAEVEIKYEIGNPYKSVLWLP